MIPAVRCTHRALTHHAPTDLRATTCPDCGSWFVVRLCTIVGCSTGRPRPRTATEIIPSNKHGWFEGAAITLELE